MIQQLSILKILNKKRTIQRIQDMKKILHNSKRIIPLKFSLEVVRVRKESQKLFSSLFKAASMFSMLWSPALPRTKRAVEVNMQLMSSCACSDKVNKDLVQSLKSCTDAIVTSSNCKKIYSSCAEIKQNNPNSASGTYEIVVNNRTLTIYCNMGTLCGVGGGWIRLGKFNVTEISTNCPSQLQLVTQSGTRLCSKNVVGCSQPVSIPSQGIHYSQVCGRVRGYQKYSTDGFHKSVNNINAAYLDGVSITRSTGSTRQHI